MYIRRSYTEMSFGLQENKRKRGIFSKCGTTDQYQGLNKSYEMLTKIKKCNLDCLKERSDRKTQSLENN